MRRGLAIALAFGSVAGCNSVSGGSNGGSGGGSTDGGGSAAFDFVLGTASYPTPDLPIPGKGVLFPDPSFHTPLVRMTDAAADHYIGPGIQNEYSKVDPENADGTLAVLRGNTAAYYLYDTSTYQPLRQLLHLESCCCQEPEPRWDASDANVFYYVCGPELRRYQVSSDSSTPVHDFRREFPSAAGISTKGEGSPSKDGRYWAFIVEDAENRMLAVAVYDKTADAVVGRKSGGFPDNLNWVGMSLSGSWAIIGYEDVAMFTDVFSRDFGRMVRLPEGSAWHGDSALDARGRDVYVYQNGRTDQISMADMETGAETALLPIPFDVNVDIGLHFSGRCSGVPGWVLVSTYGARNPPAGEQHSWMDNQLFMVELVAAPRVWRIAHTHAYTFLDADQGDKNYYAEAFAATNRACTRVYFGSNWNRFEPDYSDTYQVRLPAGWPGAMPR